MAVKVKNYKGEERTLLNPAEKGEKYCLELHTKAELYSGEALTAEKLAYRSGYVKSREDCAKAFRAGQKEKYQKGSMQGSLIAKWEPKENRKKLGWFHSYSETIEPSSTPKFSSANVKSFKAKNNSKVERKQGFFR